MPVVYTQPYARRYYARSCSVACLFTLIVLAAVLILPFVIAYSSGSFWLKINSFREQPFVAYQHQFLIVAGGSDSTLADNLPISFVWGSNAAYSDADQINARMMTVQTTQVDVNRDGKHDYMTFDITIPLRPSERIQYVRLALFFDYILSSRLRFKMQTMALIDSYAPTSSAASVHIETDLELVQRGVLLTESSAYDVPVVNFTEAAAVGNSGINWRKTIGDYAARDVRTGVTHSTPPLWTPGRPSQAPFRLTGRLTFPETTIAYLPGPWEVLKHGWVQYLAYFLLVGIPLSQLAGWVFSHQVVTTRVRHDAYGPGRPPAGVSGYKYHVY
ncbi:transmembrane protein [Phlyctochytrium arcticum]|nr:transmembrane protein [Phlyctochytrium arcticum]